MLFTSCSKKLKKLAFLTVIDTCCGRVRVFISFKIQRMTQNNLFFWMDLEMGFRRLLGPVESLLARMSSCFYPSSRRDSIRKRSPSN